MRLSRSTLGAEELNGVRSVLDSGYLTQGPVAAQFERRVADYVGAQHGFATSSCTTALHLVMAAMGIGPGDEVIVADFTFPASGNAVVQTGATPVLVDIDPNTLTARPDAVAAAVTDRTRAVMVVHAFGLCADVAAINVALAGSGIPVIEDAATALGSEQQGRRAGTLATAACFSFHPRKIITTGEGGMVTTDDDDLAARIQLLRSHGGTRGARYMSFESPGFNYRLSDINAAIGLAQMDRLEGIISNRRSLAEVYRTGLTGLTHVTPPAAPDGYRHTYQSYVCRLDPEIDRDGVIDRLAADGIESTLGTYALHCQPAFQELLGVTPGELPESEAAFNHTLTLPLHPSMSQEDVSEVIASLARATA